MSPPGRWLQWALGLIMLAGVCLASELPPMQPKKKLHVLPLAFSKESEEKYAAWISRLKSEGLGNAVWLEIEEAFYEHPSFAVVQSPIAEREFLQIIEARRLRQPTAETAYALPDKVVTINTNFFVRKEQRLDWGKAQRSETYQATVYLRYYDLLDGVVNVAVPAQADATATDPISATRTATRAAVVILLKRLDQPNSS